MISSNSSSTSLNVDSTTTTTSERDTFCCTNGKKPLKEGSVQLTSLSTLLSHHRYFFLYHETLIISKQKGACSYKLKEKLRLEKVWIASSNTADSFLIGWPFTNYLVHFRNSIEKDEWFELLSCCVQQNLRPLFTTISMDINVRGRKQTIRRRVENGKKSGEIVVDTAGDLGLPHTSYQLTFSVGDNAARSLQGPENVYVAIMSEIERQGIRISESQKCSLDTCPIANCRLILSTIKSTSAPSPRQIVNSIKRKVMARNDGRSIFGKELSGPTPPQPIMTIVDHLRMDGFDAEGIFRKSPKQSTFKELKSELDKGVVPDFHKYNTHVLASILKEYLRGIPGKILLAGNYELWMREVADEQEDGEKKINSCRGLLSHLPTSHSILLANVLKLLNKISNSPTSKMTASSLSVCLAPSFLESPDPMEGGKKIPPLVEFLISNAAQVVPGFSTDNVFSIMNNKLDQNANMMCSPAPSSSHSDDGSSQRTPIIEELNENEEDATSQSSLAESDLPEEPRVSSHLETISEISEPPMTTNDERLSFSSSESEDDEEEETYPTFSRTSFVSETLRSSTDDVLAKTTETPRSPCLKRIHFQRTELHHRTKDRPIRKTSLEEVVHARNITPTRKESKEEATQTSDSDEHRFPAFKSSAAETYNKIPCDPLPSRKPESSSSSITTPFLNDYRPIRTCIDDTVQNKPTVQVAPFSQEPSLKTINDRLNALRQNSLDPEILRKPPKSLTSSPILPARKVDLHRSSSQRGTPPTSKEIYSSRPSSVKVQRRCVGVEACVGMDPLEINWSVSQLKTLFQDKKAPAIDTMYTHTH